MDSASPASSAASSVILTAEDEAIARSLSALITRNEALSARARALSARSDKVMKRIGSLEPIVTLNVGGVVYETTRSNLTKVVGSRLEVLFSGRYAVKTDDLGHYFIDRDGALFRHVLNYLRDDQLDFSGSDEKLAALQAEFEYFGIPWPVAPGTPAPSAVDAKAGVDPLDDDLGALLDAKEARLDAVESALAAREAAVGEERALVEETDRRTADKIVLNVGGTELATTRGTLCACKDSMLGAMFAEGSRHTVAKDKKGRCFLDRDAKKFRMLLNVLRNARDGLDVVTNDALTAEMERMSIVLPFSVKRAVKRPVVATTSPASGVAHVFAPPAASPAAPSSAIAAPGAAPAFSFSFASAPTRTASASPSAIAPSASPAAPAPTRAAWAIPSAIAPSASPAPTPTRAASAFPSAGTAPSGAAASPAAPWGLRGFGAAPTFGTPAPGTGSGVPGSVFRVVTPAPAVPMGFAELAALSAQPTAPASGDIWSARR